MDERAPSRRPNLNSMIAERLSRRRFLLQGSAAATATALAIPAARADSSASAPATRHVGKAGVPLRFDEVRHEFASGMRLPDSHEASVLLRWGDTLSGPPLENPIPQSGAEQARSFGTNCDYIAYMPLPLGSQNSDHGLLAVNHEYSWPPGMFTGYQSTREAAKTITKAEVAIEMESVGLSIVEVKNSESGWEAFSGSKHNRRISATTEMELTGPVAGHPRAMTSQDETGRKVYGTFANCAGGRTPWGTVLSAEENIQHYFYGDLRDLLETHPEEVRNHRRLGVGRLSKLDDAGNRKPIGDPRNGWFRFHDRFDVTKEPREANRFGYMVEIDPYDPSWTPKKRTGLGRYRHECACVHAVEGKQVVAYSTDDAYNQFIYKFVSKGIYDPSDRLANRELLADGTLYVAKFNEDGTGKWVEMTFTEPWLTPERSGLKDQGDICIETRFAADLLGATPMDRPEDIEISPVTGRFYVTLTKHPKRKPDQVHAANPRPQNIAGHIIEVLPPGEDGERDHWSDDFEWDIFLLAGDPTSWDPNQRGQYHANVSEHGWFINPDNLAFDPDGRLWIATDGFNENRDRLGGSAPVSDGLWACETTGPNRAKTQCFFLAPQLAESTGPTFTPDGTTLFVSIQHPGVGGPFNYDNPLTRWPDFDPNIPPRPSVVAITRKDGGKIGG